MAGPLDGIKVVEVASWLAAPSAAALMCDLGADVIKVEPPGGDTYRGLLPAVLGEEPPINWVFELDNRGKRSITVALDKPDGSSVIHDLLRDADIFVTNLISPRLKRYGLEVDAVQRTNPSIVYVSLTGYGLRGPDADREGFDHTAFWSRSGIMGLLGAPDAAPSTGRGGQGDHPTGLNVLAATLAALRLRDQTGEGQVVEVTLQGTGVWSIGFDISGALIHGEQPAKMDRMAPPNPLFNAYATSDARWLLLSMATPDPSWPPFCEMMGRPEWREHAHFDTLEHRREHAAEVAAAIQALFAEHDLAHWATQLDAYKLIWAPVVELPEVVKDPQLREMGAFSVVEHPTGGSFETLSAPFQIVGADVAVRGPAPAPGQHTHEILTEYGFDDARIADLAERGVFG